MYFYDSQCVLIIKCETWWRNYIVVAVLCRKRRSPSAGARPEDYDGEWSDIETRCSVAIEGHAAAKYVNNTPI